MKKFIFYVKLGMYVVTRDSLYLGVGIIILLSLFYTFSIRSIIIALLMILPYFLVHLNCFNDVALYYYTKELDIIKNMIIKLKKD